MFLQAGFLCFPGVYLAKQKSWTYMIAPVACWLAFLYNYLACATKNPGIIPRNPAQARLTAAEAGEMPLRENPETPEAPKPESVKGTGAEGEQVPRAELGTASPDLEPPTGEAGGQKSGQSGALSLHRSRYCVTCGVKRPPLASHCRDCDNCVLQFDQ